MKNNYQIILKHTEREVEDLLKKQIIKKESPAYGGIKSIEDGFCHPGRGAQAFRKIVSVYANKDSCFFKADKIKDSVNILIDYLKKVQKEDGTFDLLTTNFYSAPDAGFITHELGFAYKILEKNKIAGKLKEKLYQVIKKAGQGMVRGGFHTPNHRWVIAAALMIAYNICGEKDFKKEAELYLEEGIDCNEKGEYTERSAGVYNAVNDKSLILLSEETGEEDYLQYVERNLKMMFYYLEPDGTIFTGNSTRQDSSVTKKYYPTRYYPLYLYMAWKNKEGRFLELADKIIARKEEYGTEIPDALHWYMVFPELKEVDIDRVNLPVSYEKFYKDSGIVRIRREEMSFTLLSNNSKFLFFQVGKLSGYMKLCASFFAVAQFQSPHLEKAGDEYKLACSTKGNYRLPLADPPPTSDWRELPHEKREIAKEVELDLEVFIKEIEKGMEIRVVTEGCEGVPLKLELVFPPDCLFSGERFVQKGSPGQGIVVESGTVEIQRETDSLKTGPGFGTHNYASQMRGSEPPAANSYTVYFTEFTNINKQIQIIGKNSETSLY